MHLTKAIKKRFSDIEKRFTKEELYQFANGEYSQLECYHFDLGMWIRNELLKDNSKLYRLFRKSGIIQRDDMSMLILQLFYLSLKAQRNKNL